MALTDTTRFGFGENWRRYLAAIDEPRVAEAEQSLRDLLRLDRLDGRAVVDIGCGSGLFSLAAWRLGAERVHSLDYDPNSVLAAEELKRRWAAEAVNWTIERGDALDPAYLSGLGQFDVVYSWGVLHHTGAMWQALDHVAELVAPGGLLALALYNDQGVTSTWWSRIKRLYCRLPGWARWLVLAPCAVRLWGPTTVRELLRGRPGRSWREYRRQRGMSPWTDVVDWVGGFPFEVARPEEVFEFYRDRGFRLDKLATCGGGRGCNEFLFAKPAAG